MLWNTGRPVKPGDDVCARHPHAIAPQRDVLEISATCPTRYDALRSASSLAEESRTETGVGQNVGVIRSGGG